MPIQIKELIIRARVNENENSANTPDGSQSPNTSTGAGDRETLVRQCVDEVLEILRLQKER